jgi:hypothetical protein
MMNPEREAILLAFSEENEVLTRNQIRERAGIRSDVQIEALFTMGALAMREWQPNTARQIYLTPRGFDMRASCVVGD